MSTTAQPDDLPPRLGLASAVAVLVGSTIGSGIFRVPAEVARDVGDTWLYLLVWVAGGILALAGALTYSELAAMYPKSGGIYVFLREAFGRPVAFLFSWAMLVVIRPAALGAISSTSASYTLRCFGFDPHTELGPIQAEQALGAVYIVLVMTVNYVGVHHAALLQNFSTILKVGALVVLVLAGFAFGEAVATTAGATEATGGFTGFFAALIPVMWAYDGWADVSFIGGEVRNPQKTLPRALFLGTALIITVYLAANFVYLHLFSIGGEGVLKGIGQSFRMGLGGRELVAADVLQLLVGPIGVVLISVTVAVSTFGTLNGTMMTSPRIFFAAARDGLFPKAIATVHPIAKTPTRAILLTASLGVIYVMVRTFSELADQFVVGLFPFYALAVAAVYVLRKRLPDAPRAYKTWGYPIVPALFLIGALLMLGNYLFTDTLKFMVNIGVVLLGLPVYWAWRIEQRVRGLEKGP